MIRVTRKILLSSFLCAFLFVQKSEAQSVIDPSDPVVEYDPLNPAHWTHYNQPDKWVRTLKIENDAVGFTNPGWNSDVYKAYNYTGLAFRVQFPKTYDPMANDGKKYPLLIFLHGQGENDHTYLPPSENYDNQWQLLQGPPQFDAAIQSGKYDGYVLAPQLQDFADGGRQTFTPAIIDKIMEIVKYMIANNKVDPFHIMLDGLSEGGLGCWDFLNQYPTYISSATPMSSPIQFVDWSNVGNYFYDKRFTPIWISQGGQDQHPWPSETQQVVDQMTQLGANFKISTYPYAGHNTWYNMWGESDFWPFVNRSYSSNPWMIGGSTRPVWPGEPINETIGIVSGFDGYQWRRNGQVIAGTGNTIQALTDGLYDAKVQRDGIWSEWSHVPVNLRAFYQAEEFIGSFGVQTEVTSDSAGGINVGYIDNGDFMDYSIKPYLPGDYTLQIRIAAQNEGGKIEIKGADSSVLATIDVPRTGGYQEWVTISTTITLPAGEQNIRIKSVAATNWNFNWLLFTLASSNSPLPAKFVYFNTQCKDASVNLQWRTAQEQNTKDFSVQRSSDGFNWSEIGKLAAAGQSTQERSYLFVDRSSGSSNNMYRIVQSDITGQQTISSIVRSSCSSVKNSISLYPNPSTGNSALNINLEHPGLITLQVLDSKGSLVQEKQIQLPQGNSSVPLNMSSYPKGVYTITLHNGSARTSIKMIKK